MGDYARAETYYLEAKDITEKALGKEHTDYTVSVSNLSFLYQAMERFHQAAEFKSEAFELRIAQVNTNFSFLSEQQRESYWKTVSWEFEAAYSLAHVYPAASVNTLNYNNTLFSKGLLLRTANAVRDAVYSSGNAELIARYEELGKLRREVSTLRQQGRNDEYVQSREARAEELDKALTRESAAYRDLQEDLALEWQNVRDSLGRDEAALEFVSFELYDKKWTDKTFYAALVLRPGMDAPLWVPLCEGAELERLFARVQNITNPLQQTRILYDDYGQELYAAIWQPLEKELEGVTTVYYSPSGLLHKVAFNAIPTGTPADARLEDKYSLNLVSSTREVALRKKAGDTPDITQAVVYGGLEYTGGAEAVEALREASLRYGERSRGITPVDLPEAARESGFGFLPGTVTESQSIQRQLRGKRIPHALYAGYEGNEESFKALDGKKTAVLHLATHGFFLEDIEVDYESRELVQRLGGGGQKAFENPLLRSGLVLAGANFAWSGEPIPEIEDGILTADEVSRLNLTGTALVVLSACQTGLGVSNNSEGVFGLQRAFKLAGAETLIMSLWSVSDDASSLLMRVFYEQWLAGKSKQDAFREARRQVRDKYPQPFYWAAFVLMD
jgi:CHAT domain-containing protein